jgi:hypothetical protein
MLRKGAQCWQEGGASSPCNSSSNFTKWTRITEGSTC